MDETLLSRRHALAAGVGLLGSVAGCTMLRSSSTDTGTDSETQTDDVDQAYLETIDSVTLIRVSGLDDPFTDQEGRGQ
ncbi:MAG: serine protease, partial [Natronococcus sp.]